MTEQAHGQEPGSSHPSTSTSSSTSTRKPRIFLNDVKHKDGHKRILRLLEEIKNNFPAYPGIMKAWQEIHQRLDKHTIDAIPSLTCLRTHFGNLLEPYLANVNDGGKDATESKVTGNPSTGGEYHDQVDTLLRDLAQLQIAENNRIAKGRADAALEVQRKGTMQQMGKEVMGSAMNMIGSGDFYRSDKFSDVEDDDDDGEDDNYDDDDDDDGEDAGPHEDSSSGDRPRLEDPPPQDRSRPARPAVVGGGGGQKKRRRRESGYDRNHINTGTDANEGFVDKEEQRQMDDLFRQADAIEVRREERQAKRDRELAREREERDARQDERMSAFVTQMNEQMGKTMTQMCQSFVDALAAKNNSDASPATST